MSSEQDVGDTPNEAEKATRERVMRSLWAELDRQCALGAGEWHTDDETGLMIINADIDPHGMATALAALAPSDAAKGDLREAVAAWRQRELQAIGAAISSRCWQSLEAAYNQLRDKMDRPEWITIPARDGIESQHGLNDVFPGDPVKVRVHAATPAPVAAGGVGELVARQFERIKSVETALANGAYYADDPQCHPCYSTLVAARQIIEAEFAALASHAAPRAAGEAEGSSQTEIVERLRKMGETVHPRIWLHGIGSDGGEVSWSNEPDPSGEPEEADWAVEYVLATPSPEQIADSAEGVIQADGEAAARLIEAYWSGADAAMMKLAESYRNGHSHGVFVRAFRDHRIAYTPRQADSGAETVEQARLNAIEECARIADGLGIYAHQLSKHPRPLPCDTSEAWRRVQDGAEDIAENIRALASTKTEAGR